MRNSRRIIEVEMVKELPLVSVIVAAYNVDQYLDKCIESLAELWNSNHLDLLT